MHPKDLARAMTWGMSANICWSDLYDSRMIEDHVRYLRVEFEKSIRRKLGGHGTCLGIRPLHISQTDDLASDTIRVRLRQTIIPLVVTRPIFVINKGDVVFTTKDIEVHLPPGVLGENT